VGKPDSAPQWGGQPISAKKNLEEKMKKSFLVGLVLLATATAVFATGKSDAKSDSSLVGIAMPETHVLRWVKDGNTLKAEAEKLGFKAEVNWANADQNLQNNQIQSYLTNKAKLLIIASVNDGVGAVVSEAAQDKIPIIAYDRIIQNSKDYDYYITFDNFKVGVFQGEGLRDAINLEAATAAAPKYITLFAGSPTDANANFFYDGAMSVLNPYIDKGVLKVVGPYPKTHADSANFQRIATENWSGTLAKTRMENLLNNDARAVTLDAVLAPNDTLARAIIEACKADAKYTSKLPATTGQDAEFASALSIKNGEQAMTVFKDTTKLAQAAIQLAQQVLSGEKNPKIAGATLIGGPDKLGGDLAEIANTGTKYVYGFLLEPIKVTKANINVPVDAGFYEAAEAAQLK
jgi:putative multiple sugar transport system substrate-binding protein